MGKKPEIKNNVSFQDTHDNVLLHGIFSHL